MYKATLPLPQRPDVWHADELAGHLDTESKNQMEGYKNY
jgi:predicted ABC-type transport system involved in lysophospholipase L1 biosynthesis ATPase subunit